MSFSRVLSAVVLSAALAGIGILGGWHAAARSGPDAGGATKEEASKAPAISDRALANMGVDWSPAVQGDFSPSIRIPAVVAEIPASIRPVSARWSGTVKSVMPGSAAGELKGPAPYAGLSAKTGTVLVEILRAPLPMLDRTLTGEIVQAVSEIVHEAATNLKSAERAFDIARLEWERVRDLNKDRPEDLPVVPRQTEINLRYEMQKAKAEMDRIEGRLDLHGLTKEQIAEVLRGGQIPPPSDLWKRSLTRNGLWPACGERILELLPESLKAHPWTFAAIGELNALGRCSDDLVNAIEANPDLGRSFLELAALIQQGHSLVDAADLFRSGALHPVIPVAAPEGADEWEIRDVKVKPGQKVESGEVLAVLADSRRMLLVLNAAGGDLSAVDGAMEAGAELDAEPVVEGAGPAIKGIRLVSYVTAPDSGGQSAYAVVENVPVRADSKVGPCAKAWKLKPGMRYMVLVPTAVFKGVFRLPRAAVVADGPEKVVFLKSGAGFKKQHVRVLHEDSEFAFIAADGAVFPGDSVVKSGAFALHLALKAVSKGVSASDEHKHGAT